MNPYETLGVPPDATPEEIKRAGRKAASAAHPDREGGDVERMKAVNTAMAILSDPERRKQYDESGSTEEKPTPQMMAENNLLQVFASILVTDTSDLLGEAKKAVRGGIATIQQKLADNTKKLQRLQRRNKKYKRKSGNNLIQMLIDQQLKECENMKRNGEEELAVAHLMEAMIAEFQSEEIITTPKMKTLQELMQEQQVNNFRGFFYQQP